MKLKDLEFPEGALLVCLSLALLFGLFAALGYLEDSRFLQRSQSAEGRIVAVQQRTEIKREPDEPVRKNVHYRPVVVFREAGGREVEFTGRYETQDESRWVTGAKVAVLYPPHEPGAARIDDPSQVHAGTRIWSIMAAISLLVGLGLFTVAKHEARAQSSRPVYRTDDEARRAYFGEHD